MQEPDIRAVGEHVYDVTISTDEGATSEHTVRVTQDVLEDWGIGLTGEPPLVRAAVQLLLEHHGDQLPAEFSINDPAVVYDGYLDQLRLALP